jgi:hypothetical protein
MWETTFPRNTHAGFCKDFTTVSYTRWYVGFVHLLTKSGVGISRKCCFPHGCFPTQLLAFGVIEYYYLRFSCHFRQRLTVRLFFSPQCMLSSSCALDGHCSHRHAIIILWFRRAYRHSITMRSLRCRPTHAPLTRLARTLLYTAGAMLFYVNNHHANTMLSSSELDRHTVIVMLSSSCALDWHCYSDTPSCYHHLVSLTDTSTCYHHLVSSSRTTHRHAIILWVRQVHRHAIILWV